MAKQQEAQLVVLRGLDARRPDAGHQAEQDERRHQQPGRRGAQARGVVGVAMDDDVRARQPGQRGAYDKREGHDSGVQRGWIVGGRDEQDGDDDQAHGEDRPGTRQGHDSSP